MNNIVIIGSGDLGQLMLHHVNTNKQTVVGFIDDFKTKGELVNNTPVIGKLSDIELLYKSGVFDEIIIGIGYHHLDFKKQLFTDLKQKGIPLATIIAQGCSIDSSSTIEEGVFILPGCTLDMNTTVKANTVINAGCVIAHDTSINKHSFLGPGVHLAGFITIGEQCFIGIGSTIIDNLTLCGKTQLGGGAVLIKSTTEPGLYVGNPAKLIKSIN